MSGTIDPVCDCCGRPVADDPAPATRVQVGITDADYRGRVYDSRKRLESAERTLTKFHRQSLAETDAGDCEALEADLATVHAEYPLASEPMDRWIDICVDCDPSEKDLIDMLGPDRPAFYGILKSRIARSEIEEPGVQPLITPIMEVRQ